MKNGIAYLNILSPVGKGTLSSIGKAGYSMGASPFIEAYPDKGWYLVKWLVNGEEVKPMNEHPFKNGLHLYLWDDVYEVQAIFEELEKNRG